MAYPDDITVSGDTAVDPNTSEGAVSYTLLGNSPGSSVRAVAHLANTAPEVLRVSHTTSKKAGLTRKRHLIRLDKEVTDSTLGKNVGASVYLVVDHPIGTDISTNVLAAMYGRITNLLTGSGYWAKLINGES